jgi:ATP-dependent helicase/nuclease subunit A
MMHWFRPPETVPRHVPAFLNPSSLAGNGRVVSEADIGERIPLKGKPDMTHVGNALHGFLAADTPGLDPDERRAIAAGLLERWELEGKIAVEDTILASDRLIAWVNEKWPGAIWKREYPVLHRLASGSTLRGTADLILDTPEGYVLIDHKSYPGSHDDALKKAASFAGQLSAYAHAVEAATGRSVNGCYIHLPVTGLVVEIERIEAGTLAVTESV